MNGIFRSHLESPLGLLQVCATDRAISAIRYVECIDEDARENEVSREGISQLSQYFLGRRRDFTLPLAPAGTAFQRAAWAALRDIPYGETRSYGDQARALGRPAAVRAVGAANGANPVAIVVPCHRVIGKNGSLTGYAGGLNRKAWLLAFEGGTTPARDLFQDTA